MSVSAVRSFFVILALAAAAAAGQAKTANADGSEKQAAFEQFKRLAGEWVGTGTGMTISFKLTSGGTAVIETDGPGTDQEMVTVIHPDGDSLLLTHYCMLGNQPQMKAPGTADGNKVIFKFVRATNLKSEKDPHMHDVTYTFVDADTLKAEWTFYQDGKPGGQATFELKRKK